MCLITFKRDYIFVGNTDSFPLHIFSFLLVVSPFGYDFALLCQVTGIAVVVVYKV